ncbi:MAG TPA: hypothetical protein DEB39_03270 [Planctomycetaceae bacterium]|nr:hypothetical protein [Planctomycetaceae bacterium]
MKKQIPPEIAKEIKQIVFCEADRENYLARSRPENGAFLNRLVAMPTVGEKLLEYMSKAGVRTYIKDAILNAYSKEMAQKKRPKNISAIIKKIFKLQAVEHVESQSALQTEIYVTASKDHFIVVADGTYLKWETALRKALYCVAGSPFAAVKDVEIKILLLLFARGCKIPKSDLTSLERALSICGGAVSVYGDE